MASPVLFVLGAGPGIGSSVAKAFARKNYRVALAARSFTDGVDDDGHLRVKLDLSKPADVAAAFAKVEKTFGPPSVVVYNGPYVYLVGNLMLTKVTRRLPHCAR